MAYKCFLDSKEEEKGSDCIESFRVMQSCFKENAEHYKEYLMEDEESEQGSTPPPPTQTEEEKKKEQWYTYNFAK